jgi:hypothetical protein
MSTTRALPETSDFYARESILGEGDRALPAGSYEGTREVDSPIVGLALTGEPAFGGA